MKSVGIVSVLLLLLISCTSSDQNTIYAKWMMHRVIQDGNDVTEEHNPYHERSFVFNHDGTFVSDGRPYGKNTGKFEYDAEDQSLFIDSDVGPEDDSNWKVTLHEDTMTWQGVGTAWAERFRIVHLRSDQ